MLSKVSHTEKEKYRMISIYMWNLRNKKMNKQNKTEIDSKYREQTWLSEGRGLKR